MVLVSHDLGHRASIVIEDAITLGIRCDRYDLVRHGDLLFVALMLHLLQNLLIHHR